MSKPLELNLRFHPSLVPPLALLCVFGLFALYITYIVIDRRFSHWLQIMAGVETVDMCDYETVCNDACVQCLPIPEN